MTVRVLPRLSILNERVEVRRVDILLYNVRECEPVRLQRLLKSVLHRAHGRPHLSLTSRTGNVQRIVDANRLTITGILFDDFIGVVALLFDAGPDRAAGRHDNNHK